MSSPYIGIEDTVIRYQDITKPLELSNDDRAVSILIKNESCNYYLYAIKKSKDGLLADKLFAAQIIEPGGFFSRNAVYPRLVNACYEFHYIAVDSANALTDCNDVVLTPFKQMSITIETEIDCK